MSDGGGAAATSSSTVLDYESIRNRFERDGYVLIENLIPLTVIDDLNDEMSRLLSSEQFDASQSSIFSPGDQQTSSEYFLGSSDKIRYFFEKDAVDPLSKMLKVEKKYSLNKIGHALHWFNSVFKHFTFSERFKLIAKSIGLIDPLVVQSMIIFKNPSLGSEVPEHQDATYLYAHPEPPRIVGFWIPLENATETNGCLQFIPGSHRTHPLNKRWIRKTDPVDGRIYMEHIDWPALDAKTECNVKTRNTAPYKSLPAKKGDCILIDGLVVHRSDQNRSKHPRPAYTFHIFDQGSNSASTTTTTTIEQHQNNGQQQQQQEEKQLKIQWQWDSLNWLQPTDQYSFPHLYSMV